MPLSTYLEGKAVMLTVPHEASSFLPCQGLLIHCEPAFDSWEATTGLVATRIAES